MLEVDENNNIFITRGDTGVFNITLKDRSGNEYTPVSGDRLQFVVSRYWGGRPIKELTQDIVPVGNHMTTEAIGLVVPYSGTTPYTITLMNDPVSGTNLTMVFNAIGDTGSSTVGGLGSIGSSVTEYANNGTSSTTFTVGTASTYTKTYNNIQRIKVEYDGSKKFTVTRLSDLPMPDNITAILMQPITIVSVVYTASGSMKFYLRPEVTEKLPFGGYVYHVKITQSNGNVSTVLSGRITLGTEAPWHFDASQNTYTSDSSSNSDSSSSGATATAQGVMVG